MVRPRRTKVLEVEGKHREIVPLGNRHHCRIDVTEAEIGERGIDLGSAAQERAREERDCVLTGNEVVEEQAGGGAGDTRSEQLVDLDDDGLRDDEVSSQLGDEGRREQVGPVSAVGRGDERTRIGRDSQRTSTSSRR